MTGIREITGYYWLVVRCAFSETWTYARQKWLTTLILSLTVVLIALIFPNYVWVPPGLHSVYLSLAILAVVVAMFFLSKLVSIPPNLHSNLQRRLCEAERSLSSRIIIKPKTGPRDLWNSGSHPSWAGLEVCNGSGGTTLTDVEVHITGWTFLWSDDHDSERFKMYPTKWERTALFWSESTSPPETSSTSIPPSSTRDAVLAYSDDKTGNEWKLNSRLVRERDGSGELTVQILRSSVYLFLTLWAWPGSHKIEVEVTSSNSPTVHREFHLAYLIQDGYGQGDFEFPDWSDWKKGKTFELSQPTR